MAQTTPCLVDPEAWDVDPGHRIPIVPVAQMINACLTQCPALDLCREVLDKGDCYGVVAGEFRQWPTATALATAFRGSSISRVMTGLRATIDVSKPGQMLPPAAELARLYGVSETTVRSALLKLAEQDVLIRGEVRSQWYRVPERTENAA